MIKTPDGFEKRTANGKFLYYHPKLKVSLAPAYVAGADFDKLEAEFIVENMQGKGVAITERSVRDIGGRKTLITRAEGFTGKSLQMITTVLFPTKSGCAQLTVICPADLPVEIREQFESAILNAIYED